MYKHLLVQKLLAEHEQMFENDKRLFDQEVQKKMFHSIEEEVDINQ